MYYQKLRNDIILQLSNQQLSKDEILNELKELDQYMKDYDCSIVNEHYDNQYLLNVYIAYKSLYQWNDTTKKNQVYILRRFIDWLTEGLNDCKYAMVRVYLEEKKQQNHFSDQALNAIKNKINTFLRWLFNQEYIHQDITVGANPIKFLKKEPIYLTLEN